MTQATLSRNEILLATGIRLHYTEAGDPSAPPVLLLHGYSDSAFSYSPIMPLLAEQAHLFALDQRGHGQSDRPLSGYSMPDFAADVIAFMDALQLPQIILIGHSMGSLIAQEVAIAAPERITGLVLLGSAANAGNIVGISELQGFIADLSDPVPEEFIREFQLSNAYQPLADDFLAQAVAESCKLPAYVWKKVLAGLMDVDNTPRLDAIRAPTLLLWGDRDSYFPRSEQEALRKGIADATLKIYSDTGHSVHWERPKETAADLGAFIARYAA
jgi:pimeloyl-ACP methyl ester carboxylesterase